VERSELPDHIPSLAEVLASFGTDFHLSLDVKDPNAGPVAVREVVTVDPTMASRLWMCDDDHDRLAGLREISPHVRLVDSTRLNRLREGPERRAARLGALGIDAINLHHSDWSGGLTTLFHRFSVLAFGWDAQFDRTLDALLTMGIDAVYSDHVPRMVDAMERNARMRGWVSEPDDDPDDVAGVR
jgi:glycerophosphoryl diester phosphodiesterase